MSYLSRSRRLRNRRLSAPRQQLPHPRQLSVAAPRHSPEVADIYVNADDVIDMHISHIIKHRLTHQLSTARRSVTVMATGEAWIKWCGDKLRTFTLYQREHDTGTLMSSNTYEYVSYSVRQSSVSIEVVGDADHVKEIVDQLSLDFMVVLSRIKWIYSKDGQYIDVPLTGLRLPTDDMYPFLADRTLTELYDDFMQSSSSVLILIGPPGTGKTSFIKGLLAHTQTSAIVTYDPGILSQDYLFAEFVDSNTPLLIIEDSDNFLTARSDGNDMMHKFLNVGDGLVTVPNKKIIFTTNLPSITHIDDALIRPGRCYDILQFEALTQKQAENLATNYGIMLTEQRDKWTMAEVLNQHKPKYNHKTGFI